MLCPPLLSVSKTSLHERTCMDDCLVYGVKKLRCAWAKEESVRPRINGKPQALQESGVSQEVPKCQSAATNTLASMFNDSPSSAMRHIVTRWTVPSKVPYAVRSTILS